MCVVHQKAVNKLDLTWKQSFLILGCIDRKSILEHYREVLTIKNLLIDIIFVMKIFSSGPFQSCLYRLMMVLNKNVLFLCLGFYHSL